MNDRIKYRNIPLNVFYKNIMIWSPINHKDEVYG